MDFEYEERWEIIKEFPDYAVSNLGNVKRITSYIFGRGKGAVKQGKDLKLRLSDEGYSFVGLHKDKKQFNKSVHQLVLGNFVGPCPEGYEPNHKDGNKRNNRIWNLEYVTKSENSIHALKNGLRKTKLKESEVKRIKKLLNDTCLTQQEISEMFKVHNATISRIKANKIWYWLEA